MKDHTPLLGDSHIFVYRLLSPNNGLHRHAYTPEHKLNRSSILEAYLFLGRTSSWITLDRMWSCWGDQLPSALVCCEGEWLPKVPAFYELSDLNTWSDETFNQSFSHSSGSLILAWGNGPQQASIFLQWNVMAFILRADIKTCISLTYVLVKFCHKWLLLKLGKVFSFQRFIDCKRREHGFLMFSPSVPIPG